MDASQNVSIAEARSAGFSRKDNCFEWISALLAMGIKSSVVRSKPANGCGPGLRCAVGLLSSLAAWLAGATVWWLIAGVLLGLLIPFTLIVILPTNKRLRSPALDRGSVEAQRLLAHWGRLHAVRTVLSGLALLLFLYVAIFRKAI